MPVDRIDLIEENGNQEYGPRGDWTAGLMVRTVSVQEFILHVST
jgi:hypothetical protein